MAATAQQGRPSLTASNPGLLFSGVRPPNTAGPISCRHRALLQDLDRIEEFLENKEKFELFSVCRYHITERESTLRETLLLAARERYCSRIQQEREELLQRERLEEERELAHRIASGRATGEERARFIQLFGHSSSIRSSSQNPFARHLGGDHRRL